MDTELFASGASPLPLPDVRLANARAADAKSLVAELGSLPRAPLAMPKQKLEHETRLLRRLLRLIPMGATRIEG